MQELGVTEGDRLKFWSALFFAATPLVNAITAPIWRALSNRFDRKLMMGTASRPEQLVVVLMRADPYPDYFVTTPEADDPVAGSDADGKAVFAYFGAFEVEGGMLRVQASASVGLHGKVLNGSGKLVMKPPEAPSRFGLHVFRRRPVTQMFGLVFRLCFFEKIN